MLIRVHSIEVSHYTRHWFSQLCAAATHYPCQHWVYRDTERSHQHEIIQIHLTMPGYHGKPRHLAQTQWRGRSVEARTADCMPLSDFFPGNRIQMIINQKVNKLTKHIGTLQYSHTIRTKHQLLTIQMATENMSVWD